MRNLLLALATVLLLPPVATAAGSDAEWAEQEKSSRDADAKRMKISNDIACGMCRFVAVSCCLFFFK